MVIARFSQASLAQTVANIDDFRHIYEAKVQVNGLINGQKYTFTGKITYAYTVCTKPFLLLLKGPGYEASKGRNNSCMYTQYSSNSAIA